MTSLYPSALVALLLTLALFWSAANAAECSDADYQSTEDLYVAAAATSACSSYATTSSLLVSVYAPCSATDCVAVMTQLAADLPDCEYYGVNQKTSLADSLEICMGDSAATTDSTTSVVTSAPVSSSTTITTPTPTSSSTTDCTADEYQSVEDLYDAAAATDACSPYASTSTLLVSIAGPCTATDCVAVMTQLAADLPDCLYDGANEKTELTDSLSVCTDDTTSEVDSSTPVATSASIPASTASSTSCTTTEVQDMWDQYVSTALSDECAADSSVGVYSVNIFTSCGSDCADKIKDLAEELPNCYYDYDLENKKQDVLEELEGCDESSSYISVTVYPDSTVEFTSTSSSAPSDEDTTTVTSDGSEVSPSNGDPAGTTAEASAVGSVSASPRASSGMRQLWAISALLAGVFLAL
jgi:DNA-binding FrmR family transcriptional regulator